MKLGHSPPKFNLGSLLVLPPRALNCGRSSELDSTAPARDTVRLLMACSTAITLVGEADEVEVGAPLPAPPPPPLSTLLPLLLWLKLCVLPLDDENKLLLPLLPDTCCCCGLCIDA